MYRQPHGRFVWLGPLNPVLLIHRVVQVAAELHFNWQFVALEAEPCRDKLMGQVPGEVSEEVLPRIHG
jgi:hypothetical protein